MFQKLVAMDRDAHQTLRFNSATGYGFAAGLIRK
jgi:hypothetical protein